MARLVVIRAEALLLPVRVRHTVFEFPRGELQASSSSGVGVSAQRFLMRNSTVALNAPSFPALTFGSLWSTPSVR